MFVFTIALVLVPDAPSVTEIAIALSVTGHKGVRYAASVLASECPSAETRFGAEDAAPMAVRAGLDGDALVASAPPLQADLGAEGFAVHATGDAITVVATAPTGLMYGLLEVAERFHNHAGFAAHEVTKPIVSIRGDYLDLPFYLGCDLYDGRWRWKAQREASPDNWFHDRDGWRRRLETYARRRMNCLLFAHPHPFPAFLTYPSAPEAAYFDDATVARNAESLAWLIEEAAAYGVSIYFLTWNEWVPRNYALAHGIPAEGPGTPEAAELNRYSYAELFRRFPGLGGLVTQAGESPPGCVEFVRDNVVAPLSELSQPPHIIFWTWCAYPEDVSTVLDGYPGQTSIMHYLQYEQLFKPMVDPRVGMMSRACGGRPVVVMGGLGTATAQLYWADPFFIRDILRHVPEQNVSGIFFLGLDSWSWVSNKWIGWEALARYWWDPFRDDDASYWEQRIADVCGDEAFGAPLLSAYVHASAVPTRMLCLLHSQSDIFRPQYGLPLVFYLGMPTLSTYVFENHEYIDEQGRLAPRMGLTWPNPDWGEVVIGAMDQAAAIARGEDPVGTTALEIADELDGHATAVEDSLATLEPLRLRWRADHMDFDVLCDQLRMNALLARHTAAKTRAALAWELWRRGIAQPDQVLGPLDESVKCFREYAAVAQKLYPGNYGQVRRNVLSKPPPWTHLDLWNHSRYVPDYNFLEYARRFERERDLIATAMEQGRAELPYEEDLVAPLAGEVVARIDKGLPSGGFATHDFPPNATATVADGRLVCDLRGTAADFYFPFTTDPSACPLEVGTRYEVVFRYEIIRVGDVAPLQLSFGARTTEGGWQQDVGVRYFSGPAGTTGEIRTQFVPAQYDDYYVYLSMNGNGTIAVENVHLVRGAKSSAR